MNRFYQRKLFLRNTKIKNITNLNLLDKISVSSLLKPSTGFTFDSFLLIFLSLKLSFLRNPAILRTYFSSASKKLKRGAPIGVKLTIRKNNLFKVVESLIYLLIPSLNQDSFVQSKNTRCVRFTIRDLFIIPELQKYFFFLQKNQSELIISIILNSYFSKKITFFLLSLLELPVKNK